MEKKPKTFPFSALKRLYRIRAVYDLGTYKRYEVYNNTNVGVVECTEKECVETFMVDLKRKKLLT